MLPRWRWSSFFTGATATGNVWAAVGSATGAFSRPAAISPDGGDSSAVATVDALRKALTPETRARATAVAGTIRSDRASVASKLLLNAVSRERPPVSA